MAIQPVYENLRLNARKRTATKQFKVECKTNIPTEKSSGILDVSVFVGALNYFAEEGKLKFEGTAVFSAFYDGEDGILNKCDCSSPFSAEIEDAFIVVGAGATLSVKTVKTGFENAETVSLYAVLSAEAEISEEKNLAAITGGENLYADKNEVAFTGSFGIKRSDFPLSEEFELNYPVAEVLSHGISSVVTAVQCGVGAIIIDGETTVSSLLLQNSDKSDIIKEEKTFPFRAEIEYDEAMPSMRAIAVVNEKSFNSEISVDEESGSSVVSVSAVLSFSGEAFSDEKALVATDVFSEKDKTEPVFETCDCDCPADARTCRFKVSGRANADGVPAGAKIMAVGGERVEITSATPTDGGLKIVGVLSVKAFFKDGEGKNFTVSLETPFEEATDCAVPENCSVSVCAAVRGGGARIVSFSEAEIGAEIILTIYPTLKCRVNVMSGVNCVGEKPIKNCAVSVYIPEENEDLWALSKRLNVCPDSLLATNKDLQFPLTGKERIVVYRTL